MPRTIRTRTLTVAMLMLAVLGGTAAPASAQYGGKSNTVVFCSAKFAYRSVTLILPTDTYPGWRSTDRRVTADGNGCATFSGLVAGRYYGAVRMEPSQVWENGRWVRYCVFGYWQRSVIGKTVRQPWSVWRHC